MRKSILAVSVALAFGGVSMAHAVDSQVVQRNTHEATTSQTVEGESVYNQVVQRNSHEVSLEADQSANVINNNVVQRNAGTLESRVSQDADTINNYIEGEPAEQVVSRVEGNYNRSHQNASVSAHHEQRITGLEQDVHTLRNDVDQLKGGVALGIAVGTLQYDLSDASSTQMSIATGYYSDHSAIAVGLGTPLSDNAFFNGNVSATNDGQAAVGAGLTFKFQ